MACAGPSTLPATITLQKSAPEAARQLLLGSHVLSRKAIQGYQAMDNLPHPLRCCSKLRSVPCPSLTSNSMLTALLLLLLFMEMVPRAKQGWMGTGILRPHLLCAGREEEAAESGTSALCICAPSSDMSPTCQKVPLAKNINRSPMNYNFK